MHFASDRLVEYAKHESVRKALRGVADGLRDRENPRRVSEKHGEEAIDRAAEAQ